MNTKYSDVIDSVFNKLKDYSLYAFTDEQAYEIMLPYLQSAIVKFNLSCKQDLEDRDDIIGEFNYKLTDNNFEILSNYTLIEYIDSNYIRTTLMLKAHLSSSDFKSYNSNQTLEKVMEMRNLYMKENKQLMVDTSYNKSDLFDIIKKRK